MCLNPRFDGAFLNYMNITKAEQVERLNPRFDGAFLNSRKLGLKAEVMRLNPRFDGAFLNLYHRAAWDELLRS